MQEYYVTFKLRKDTSDYKKTNLRDEKRRKEIEEGLREFHYKNSRLTDEATAKLIKVEEKNFLLKVQIHDKFAPPNRSFYTRVGSISRFLKEAGMKEILSPQGKLFNLYVEGVDNTEVSETGVNNNARRIELDHNEHLIVIPAEYLEKYLIKIIL